MNYVKIEEVFKEIKSTIDIETTNIDIKINNFISEFNTEFDITDAKKRAKAEVLAWAGYDTIIKLYILGLNGSCIIELHSVLERLISREINNYFNLNSYESISSFFKKLTLYDYSYIIEEMGIINLEDKKFLQKLNKMRNSFAHKNEKIFSNIFLSGRKISFLDIDSQSKNFDCLTLILNSIRILIKIADYSMNS